MVIEGDVRQALVSKSHVHDRAGERPQTNIDGHFRVANGELRARRQSVRKSFDRAVKLILRCAYGELHETPIFR